MRMFDVLFFPSGWRGDGPDDADPQRPTPTPTPRRRNGPTSMIPQPEEVLAVGRAEYDTTGTTGPMLGGIVSPVLHALPAA